MYLVLVQNIQKVLNLYQKYLKSIEILPKMYEMYLTLTQHSWEVLNFYQEYLQSSCSYPKSSKSTTNLRKTFQKY